ncbi:katanin p60 ATPase-containing subunit A-like 2 [Sitophilus oryzae]|uniref:Katanin p60 ATPase-containing subunit A-like 2 n=1 Tax=Sitophilus oryzae TaxID=7048 RepID=A0A6J2XTY8_SITOR|nr:katanin p60 ATPase-containing subunit A-like 2 [Sitophilus oryzae]
MANIITPKNSSRNIKNSFEKFKDEARERKRNILYLILGYLRENKLDLTVNTLENEAKLDHRYQICENVELDVILQEYQSYYFTKFQKYPKIIRKLEEDEQKSLNYKEKRSKSGKRLAPSFIPKKEVTIQKNDGQQTESDVDFQFDIVSLNKENSGNNKEINIPKRSIFKTENPETEYHSHLECGDLVNQIRSQIITDDTRVNWEDCLGLEGAVETLKEASIYPFHYPELFKDIIPWKGVLLHGPPGTGKTLLAKALASESNATFFNVTNSVFISKWRGESEKLIKYLFDLAKHHAPSVIFFDEIDSVISSVNDTQHEAAKRFKSELLVNLDGIISNEEHVLILASTNSPWDLDNALLRRFDKRILINLPNKETRIQILNQYLKNSNVVISDQEYIEFGNLTENYSGSDIKILSKEITMSVVRENIKTAQVNRLKVINNRKIVFSDVKMALQKTRPSVNSIVCRKYFQWQNEHGSI